jgi:thioredoxin 1
MLDFWAEWCPPCKKLKPVIESMESPNYDIAFLNVDELE